MKRGVMTFLGFAVSISLGAGTIVSALVPATTLQAAETTAAASEASSDSDKTVNPEDPSMPFYDENGYPWFDPRYNPGNPTDPSLPYKDQSGFTWDSPYYYPYEDGEMPIEKLPEQTLRGSLSAVKTTKSKSEAMAWCNSKTGTTVIGPNHLGGVCEDYADAYISYITNGALTSAGSGFRLSDIAANMPSNWLIIQNGSPEKGDIVLDNQVRPSLYRHVEICAGRNSAGYLLFYGQNMNGDHTAYYSNTMLENPVTLANWIVMRPTDWPADSQSSGNAENDAGKQNTSDGSGKQDTSNDSGKNNTSNGSGKSETSDGSGKNASDNTGKKDETNTDYSIPGLITFSDVPSNAWYHNAVIWATQLGITSGTTKDTFSPNLSCTRAQAVTFLYNMAARPPITITLRFRDVPTDAWYARAVSWAVQEGITSGTGSDTFSPNEPCTRAQLVTFLYKAKRNPSGTSSTSFRDVPAGAWYAAPVSWAVANGITSGVGDNQFGPDRTCTRAEAVTFLYHDGSIY